RPALLAPGGGEAVQRRADRGGHRRLELGQRLGVVDRVRRLDHTAQRQEAVHRRRRGLARLHIRLAGGQVTLQLLRVEFTRARAPGAPRLDAEGQLAALEAALGAFTRRAFQALEAGGPTETHLEIAAVDAARLHRPAPGPERPLRAPEPGHPAQAHLPAPA